MSTPSLRRHTPEPVDLRGILFLVTLMATFAVSWDSVSAQSMFIRGDADGDGTVTLSDAIANLDFQFAGGETDCLSALDFNDSGSVGLEDAVQSLAFLFLSGPAPEPPFPLCGLDPTDDSLGCVGPFAACEEFEVSIDSPEADAIVGSPFIDVRGSLGEFTGPDVTAVVNGVEADTESVVG